MASWPPLKNSEFTLVGIIRDADGDIVTSHGTLSAKISKDAETDNDTTNTPTAIGSTNRFIKLVITATEMNADSIAITIADTASGAKEFFALIYTDTVQISGISQHLLAIDLSTITSEAARSPLNAFRLLRNKRSVAAGSLTVTEEDDSTTAWTATVATSAGADPITSVDPA